MVRAVGVALLLAQGQAACVDDVSSVVKTGRVLGQDIIKTVRDCHEGNKTACAADVEIVTGAAGELQKAIVATGEDCGHVEVGCSTAVHKVGSDIEDLKVGVKDIVDACIGQGHSTIKCGFAVLEHSKKGVQLVNDVTGAVHACNNFSKEGCIADVTSVVKTGGVLGKDLIATVKDCHKGDESACAADVETVTGASGELEKAIAGTAEHCGHTGVGCATAVQKVGSDIEDLKVGVKAILDGCTGKDHGELKCLEAVLALSPKGVQIASDVMGATHACKKNVSATAEDSMTSSGTVVV